MTTQLTIIIAGIIGLIVGLAIGRQGRKERDARISELEKELTTQRNVVKALNEDNVVLRRRLKKKGGNYEQA